MGEVRKMAKMNVDDFIAKAIAYEKLPSLYQLGTFMNKYKGKYLLSDCFGFIKGILWGYPNHGQYGSQNVKDINANTMIKQCSHVSDNMQKAQKGWLVWMDGHIGIYIGDGIVIESSPIWENGIQRTYCKGCGIKNKYQLHERQWKKCGMLDQYINYNEHVKVNAFYRVKTKKHGWLKEVKNLQDYAGYQESPIIAVALRVDQGKIKYRVHIKNGKWLGWIEDYDVTNIKTGYAGNNKEIDAIQIYYYTPSNIRPYQKAKYKTDGDWQYDNETSHHQKGYAGRFNQVMTRLSLCIE